MAGALLGSALGGLDAGTLANYGMAIRHMANGTGAYLWGSLAAALSKLVNVPAGARLWYDTSRIPALRADEIDRASAMQVKAATMSTLLSAGYTPDSIATYISTDDASQLQHTGLVSVQLYKAAAKEDPVVPTTAPEGGTA